MKTPVLQFIDHVEDVILAKHDGRTFIINAVDAVMTKGFRNSAPDHVVGYYTAQNQTHPILKKGLYGTHVLELCEWLVIQ